jgi:hypothetical protein
MVDGVSDAAGEAAAALKNLQSQIESDVKALAQLEKVLKNLKRATQPNKEEIDRVTKAIAALKDRIAGSQASVIAQGGSLVKTTSKADAFRQKLQELSKAASLMPGPLGGVISRLAAFASAGSGAKIALVAVAAGFVALAVGAAVAAKSLTNYAVQAQNARRAELLQLDSVTKLRTVYAAAFGLPRDNAAQLQTTIDKVSASVSIGRDEVAQYAIQLEKMGVRANNMPAALKAVATAASGWGAEQANQTAAWAAQLAITGGNVNKLAERVDRQIGGNVKKRMLDLNVQQKKLAESQQALFGSVDISGLLKANKAFNDMFAQSTNSGRALKQLLGSLIQPMVDAWTAGLTASKNFFLQLMIWGVRVGIMWQRLRLGLRDLGLEAYYKELTGNTEALIAVGSVLAYNVLPPLAIGLWGVAKAMGAVAVKVAIATWPFILAAAAIWGLIKIVELLYVIWREVDWPALGKAVWDGIVGFLVSAKDKIADVFRSLAKTCSNAFKKAIGSNSPSKLFAEYGQDITAGLTLGIEAGTPKAQQATEAMIKTPDASGVVDSIGGGRAAGGAGSGVAIATLNVYCSQDTQPSDAKQIAASIKRELENILASVAVQMGAPVT